MKTLKTDNAFKKMLEEIFYSSLKAVAPYEAVRYHTDKIRSVYQKGNFKKLVVAGFGKAACPMAKAVEDELSDLLDDGAVITKYGHCEGQGSRVRGQGVNNYPSLVTRHPSLKIFEAGHPLPDKNGIKGTEEIINLLENADENTLVVCLISGGGSALLVSPYKGISLSEKQEITDLLLKSGADIYELNTIRKHISKVKGGRLAEIAWPAKIISLVLSDVIGDKLDVIASGPTSPDTSTYHDALKVMKKYGLMDKSPNSIIEILQKGKSGLVPETPKGGDKLFEGVENIIIGSSRTALDAAKRKAEELGFHAEILSSGLAGEAREVGKWLAEKAKEAKGARCVLSGGETTVTVKGSGLGGRNMELALAFAMEIEDIDGITLLSAGTDGTDGPTDAAGAIVNGDTVRKAKAAGLAPMEYLNNNDSYNFFKEIDGLFITGPTGTNVMDLQIALIE
ncbi:MAG: glycerate kinase [Nitrospiraceae bacterium]|nr:MAG: glycerate kinase [Nitrospiraceae bacterium]